MVKYIVMEATQLILGTDNKSHNRNTIFEGEKELYAVQRERLPHFALASLCVTAFWVY